MYLGVLRKNGWKGVHKTKKLINWNWTCLVPQLIQIANNNKLCKTNKNVKCTVTVFWFVWDCKCNPLADVSHSISVVLWGLLKRYWGLLGLLRRWKGLWGLLGRWSGLWWPMKRWWGLCGLLRRWRGLCGGPMDIAFLIWCSIFCSHWWQNPCCFILVYCHLEAVHIHALIVNFTIARPS